MPVERKFCWRLILVSQLAWILPFTFLFFSQTSVPSVIIVRDNNISRSLLARGFSEPVKVFREQDLSMLKKIDEEWTKFWPETREKLISHGFLEPFSRTCFLWLPDCQALAKNQRILQVVTEAIGPKVLLYGVTVWRGKHESAHSFHVDPETAGCEKCLYFVSGAANIQLISYSHKMAGRSLRSLLQSLRMAEVESLTISNQSKQIAFLERSVSHSSKRMIRRQEIRLENLQVHNGSGVFFNGGMIYRLVEASLQGRALLLQFISAECKVRDSRQFTWRLQGMQETIYMPPVLLVSGDHAGLKAFNDVRLSLVKAPAVRMKIGNIDHNILGDKFVENLERKDMPWIQNITFFPMFKSSMWHDVGIWKYLEVGRATTEVVARSRIDYFMLRDKFETLSFGRAIGEGEILIVVQQEGMLYFRAVNDDDFSFVELFELKPGSAIVISKEHLHAFAPLGLRTSFISFRWLGYGKKSTNETAHGFGITEASEGRTVVLSSGQAYDPDNDENCDVSVFVVEGSLLQVLPLNATLQASDVLLIPAGQSCILWNIGGLPVKFFVMHLCCASGTDLLSASYGSGKIF